MSVAEYYVEVWRPNGEKAADFAQMITFKEALDWLLVQQAHDASLHLRLVTSEPILADDDETLRHFGVHLVTN